MERMGESRPMYQAEVDQFPREQGAENIASDLRPVFAGSGRV